MEAVAAAKARDRRVVRVDCLEADHAGLDMRRRSGGHEGVGRRASKASRAQDAGRHGVCSKKDRSRPLFSSHWRLYLVHQII
eukprot:7224456-Prymnesium_polylepis.1